MQFAMIEDIKLTAAFNRMRARVYGRRGARLLFRGSRAQRKRIRASWNAAPRRIWIDMSRSPDVTVHYAAGLSRHEFEAALWLEQMA